MKRNDDRKKAFQTLFQLDFNKEEVEIFINDISEGYENTFYNRIISGVVNHLEKLDEMIEQNLEKWSIDRLAKVEKTIIRMAIYEIKFMEDIPKKVSINEAVELAKKFGDEQAGQFVNGVLAKFI